LPAKEKIVFREKGFPFQSGLVTQFVDKECRQSLSAKIGTDLSKKSISFSNSPDVAIV